MNNLIPEEFQKIIRSYTLFDDVYMNIFFKDEPEIIQFVLRLILDKPDLIVESVHIQDVMTDLVAKTSRLDILAKDKQDKQYNIEFQVELNPNLVKRGRYYLSQLDMQCIHRGEDYDQLPDTYVIFICRGDVIKREEPIYRFTMKDQFGNQLNSGQHLLFINADHKEEWRLKALMDDFKCPDPKQMRYNILKERANYFKGKEEGTMYFTPETQKVIDEVVQAHYGDQIREACAETHEKAHAEGLAEGHAQTLKEIVCNALRKNKSFETISEITDLPISEIEKIQQEMIKKGSE